MPGRCSSWKSRRTPSSGSSTAARNVSWRNWLRRLQHLPEVLMSDWRDLIHKLVARLADVFPNSVHVRDIGLQAATDSDIAKHALAEGLTIVSKDADFLALRFVLSREQIRMVWVRLGNGSTEQVEAALR